mgnify:CR=1 FL=1
MDTIGIRTPEYRHTQVNNEGCSGESFGYHSGQCPRGAQTKFARLFFCAHTRRHQMFEAYQHLAPPL